MPAIAVGAVTLLLYFTNDIGKLNERIGTTYAEQPSWVFEAQGDLETLKRLSEEYSNLSRATDKYTKETELVDAREGHIGQYQDVSPFIVFLITELGYTPDPSNPPSNTANYSEGQVLKWILTKSS